MHAWAGGNEHEAGDGDGANQFPAAIGNEDAGGEVVGKDASAHHLQGNDAAYDAGEQAEDDQDAAYEFNGGRYGSCDGGGGNAHALEGLSGAGDGPFGELLSAVGDEDYAQDDACCEHGE